MASRPRYSVIIPTFNRAALVGESIDSVLAQRRDDVEVIVVDDGSTDATGETLRAYGDRVRALRQENRGASAARNLGIEAARGEYVCTLDSDDLWFPWTLRVFDEVIAATRPSLVSGSWVWFRDRAELASQASGPVAWTAFDDYLASSRAGYCVSSGNAVYRADALRAVGGFDVALRNAEDHDLALRLGTAPGFVKVLTPVTVACRLHDVHLRTVSRSADALLTCVEREAAGRYPGEGRARDRERVLGARVRPLTLECLRAGERGRAARLYARTFAWQVRQARLRFLLGVPALLALAHVRRRAPDGAP
jgi:GT2 family glycosyltransferase